MKAKATKPVNTTPKVSITRPEAIVTVEISSVAHKISEQEAKDLHAKLSSALGIFPPVPQRPQREHTPWIPRYLDRPMTPNWTAPDVVTCLLGRD